MSRPRDPRSFGFQARSGRREHGSGGGLRQGDLCACATAQKGPVSTSGARGAAWGVARLGDRDAEAAGRDGPGPLRALPRGRADAGGREGRARGDAPSPPARGLPRRGSRDALGPSPRRGGGARALHLRGPRAPDRQEARQSGPRSARRSDPDTGARPGCRPDDRPRGARARGRRRPSRGSRTQIPRCSAISPSAASVPGARLRVTGAQPFGGPLFVEVEGREHVLGGELAEKMRVQVSERSPGRHSLPGRPASGTEPGSPSRTGWR